MLSNITSDLTSNLSLPHRRIAANQGEEDLTSEQLNERSSQPTHPSPTLDPTLDPTLERMLFVEDMGLMFETIRMPRMSGRIFGWLLISDPPQQPHSALAEVLQASKGSISSMTRLLLQLGLIERISLPGDRRDYFQIKPHAWSQMMTQRMIQIMELRKLADKGLALLESSPPKMQQRLQEMRDFHAFWERELPLIDERWEKEKLKW